MLSFFPLSNSKVLILFIIVVLLFINEFIFLSIYFLACFSICKWQPFGSVINPLSISSFNALPFFFDIAENFS